MPKSPPTEAKDTGIIIIIDQWYYTLIASNKYAKKLIKEKFRTSVLFIDYRRLCEYKVRNRQVKSTEVWKLSSFAIASEVHS